MLNIRRRYSDQTRLVVIMSEIAVQAAAVKIKMTEISKQAGALAMGLQNAAPSDAPNPSIQYLSAISEKLSELVEECDLVINPGSATAVTEPTTDSGK